VRIVAEEKGTRFRGSHAIPEMRTAKRAFPAWDDMVVERAELSKDVVKQLFAVQGDGEALAALDQGEELAVQPA
jgi:hypothetical protein